MASSVAKRRRTAERKARQERALEGFKRTFRGSAQDPVTKAQVERFETLGGFPQATKQLIVERFGR